MKTNKIYLYGVKTLSNFYENKINIIYIIFVKQK